MVKISTPWKRNPAGPQVWVLVMSTCSAGTEKVIWMVAPVNGAVAVTLPTGVPPGAKP